LVVPVTEHVIAVRTVPARLTKTVTVYEVAPPGAVSVLAQSEVSVLAVTTS
jgi:hypothetical protein